MWNIEFKGKLKGDIEQISSGAPLPEGSVMFKEPDSSDKAFAQGGLIALPLILIMIGLAVFRICTVYSKPDGLNFKTFALPFGISFALMLLSQYIHEYIHAFLMPRSIKKQIYVMPQNQMLFVYIEDPIPKTSFLISLFGPAVILGIIPFVIWFIIAPMLTIPITLAVLMYSVMMTACALGDYLNAYNCIKQVPKNGKVFNRGFHSYWINTVDPAQSTKTQEESL